MIPEPRDATADRWESDLLASVCHDLKTPLASLVMGVAFLRRVLPAEQASALRVVDAMHRSGQRMDRLIESFSSLAKLQSGNLRLQLGLHDVAVLAREACQRFTPEASAQGTTLSLEDLGDSEGILLPCDGERLVQALVAMASCALRVLPEDGSLAIRLKVAHSLVRFEVEARLDPDRSRRDEVPKQPSGPTSQNGAQRKSQPLTAKLPVPELAIANGLIALHGAQLEIIRDDERLELSCSLPRDRGLLAPGNDPPASGSGTRRRAPA